MKRAGKISISKEELDSLVYYDPTSFSGLRWKRSRRSFKQGTEAGYIRVSNNYKRIIVKILGKDYVAARIIWEIMKGEIPDEYVVDHIDANSLNNNINNLRLVTKKQNSHNRGSHPKNNSGVPGVRWIEYTRKDGVTKKLVKSTCAEHCCHFSVEKLGEEKAFEMACRWRLAKIAELNRSEDCDFTELHVKDVIKWLKGNSCDT